MSTPRGRRLARTLALVLVALLLLLAARAVWLRFGAPAVLADAGAGAGPAAAVRDLLADAGALAPLLYVAFVTVEVVVAPLPGVLLYAPGGVLFGGLQGGALALLGNVLGAAIAFAIARRLGRDRARAWLRDSRLGVAEHRLTDNGLLVVFLLRLNPLTSSDLVSYAAGLTAIPASRLLAGTALGLAPLCWAQAYAAEGLAQRYPWLLYAAVAAALLYLIAAAWLLLRVVGKARSQEQLS